MNTRSLTDGQNLARNSQCFHKKPKQVQEYYNWIRSGRYLKRENLLVYVVPGQTEFANLSGFLFS